MGRPRPNDTEPASQESFHGDTDEINVQSGMHHVGRSPPPSDQSGPHEPSMESVAPIPFPPGGPKPSNGTPLHQQASSTQVGRPWKTGLFDCGQHQTNAIVTAFFPCVTFGQIAEILDEGETSCTLGSFLYILMAPALCTCWILGSSYRQKLRKKYNLVQAPSEDWTVHLFCPFCSLCQEFRELQNRGIDPSLGWMGYLAQQQETTTLPPNTQSMSM